MRQYDETTIAAYREAGHAVAAYAMQRQFGYVTIASNKHAGPPGRDRVGAWSPLMGETLATTDLDNREPDGSLRGRSS